LQSFKIMTRRVYITKPIKATEYRKSRPSEIFIRSPDGNKRQIGGDDFKRIGRLIYCSLEEAAENIRISEERAKSENKTWQDVFREIIFFAGQMQDEPGGIIIYERLEEKDKGGKPKVKRSYSLVEKVREE